MRIIWEVIGWTCITLAFIMGIIALVLAIISSRNVKKRRGELAEVHT